MDIGEYQIHIEHYNDRFGEFDRVLVGLGTEQVPGAHFSRARRVDRVPELVFSAYHPDMTYIMDGGNSVDGPLGAYHSMIAFVAHRTGRSVVDTLPPFNGRIYAACGYLDCWAAARDNLIWYCDYLGYDVGQAIRRWGQRGAFMYSTNHPRIHVLYDIARIYLEREGYEPRVTDLLPHDNLANSSVFPIYPEIGEALGVPGSYLFKRGNEYTQIDLRQFVEESFAAFDSHAPRVLEVQELSRATFERVTLVLDKERLAA